MKDFFFIALFALLISSTLITAEKLTFDWDVTPNTDGGFNVKIDVSQSDQGFEASKITGFNVLLTGFETQPEKKDAYSNNDQPATRTNSEHYETALIGNVDGLSLTSAAGSTVTISIPKDVFLKAITTTDIDDGPGLIPASKVSKSKNKGKIFAYDKLGLSLAFQAFEDSKQLVYWGDTKYLSDYGVNKPDQSVAPVVPAKPAAVAETLTAALDGSTLKIDGLLYVGFTDSNGDAATAQGASFYVYLYRKTEVSGKKPAYDVLEYVTLDSPADFEFGKRFHLEADASELRKTFSDTLASLPPQRSALGAGQSFVVDVEAQRTASDPTVNAFTASSEMPYSDFIPGSDVVAQRSDFSLTRHGQDVDLLAKAEKPKKGQVSDFELAVYLRSEDAHPQYVFPLASAAFSNGAYRAKLPVSRFESVLENARIRSGFTRQDLLGLAYVQLNVGGKPALLSDSVNSFDLKLFSTLRRLAPKETTYSYCLNPFDGVIYFQAKPCVVNCLLGDMAVPYAPLDKLYSDAQKAAFNPDAGEKKAELTAAYRAFIVSLKSKNVGKYLQDKAPAAFSGESFNLAIGVVSGLSDGAKIQDKYKTFGSTPSKVSAQCKCSSDDYFVKKSVSNVGQGTLGVTLPSTDATTPVYCAVTKEPDAGSPYVPAAYTSATIEDANKIETGPADTLADHARLGAFAFDADNEKLSSINAFKEKRIKTPTKTDVSGLSLRPANLRLVTSGSGKGRLFNVLGDDSGPFESCVDVFPDYELDTGKQFVDKLGFILRFSPEYCGDQTGDLADVGIVPVKSPPTTLVNGKKVTDLYAKFTVHLASDADVLIIVDGNADARVLLQTVLQALQEKGQLPGMAQKTYRILTAAEFKKFKDAKPDVAPQIEGKKTQVTYKTALHIPAAALKNENTLSAYLRTIQAVYGKPSGTKASGDTLTVDWPNYKFTVNLKAVGKKTMSLQAELSDSPKIGINRPKTLEKVVLMQFDPSAVTAGKDFVISESDIDSAYKPKTKLLDFLKKERKNTLFDGKSDDQVYVIFSVAKDSLDETVYSEAMKYSDAIKDAPAAPAGGDQTGTIKLTFHEPGAKEKLVTESAQVVSVKADGVDGAELKNDPNAGIAGSFTSKVPAKKYAASKLHVVVSVKFNAFGKANANALVAALKDKTKVTLENSDIEKGLSVVSANSAAFDVAADSDNTLDGQLTLVSINGKTPASGGSPLEINGFFSGLEDLALPSGSP